MGRAWVYEWFGVRVFVVCCKCVSYCTRTTGNRKWLFHFIRQTPTKIGIVAVVDVCFGCYKTKHNIFINTLANTDEYSHLSFHACKTLRQLGYMFTYTMNTHYIYLFFVVVPYISYSIRHAVICGVVFMIRAMESLSEYHTNTYESNERNTKGIQRDITNECSNNYHSNGDGDDDTKNNNNNNS